MSGALESMRVLVLIDIELWDDEHYDHERGFDQEEREQIEGEVLDAFILPDLERDLRESISQASGVTPESVTVYDVATLAGRWTSLRGFVTSIRKGKKKLWA